MRRLRWLNLKGNKLNESSFSSTETKSDKEFHKIDEKLLPLSTVPQSFERYENLRTLILNSCMVPFETVVNSCVLNHLPKLEELHLTDNKYATLLDPSTDRQIQHDSLKMLYLNGNQIEEWRQIELAASLFPNLEHLFVSDNPLRDMRIEEDEEYSFFKKLKQLIVNRVMWREWSSLDFLANKKHFPALEHVRMACTGPNLPPILNDLASTETENGDSTKNSKYYSNHDIFTVLFLIN